MVQQHIFDISEAEADLSCARDAVLRFDPAAAVKAIVFHLLDEKMAASVADETVCRTVDRMRGKSIELSIARRRWVKMTNPQRLRWLLRESQTTLRIGANDVVRLRARRGRS